MSLFSVTGPVPSGLPSAFRQLARTGVVHVLAEAAARGYGRDGKPWANMGQGAPETGPLPGAPERMCELSFDCDDHEYAPLAGLLETREAVAALYNARYRRGKASQYTAENVLICPGGRAGLARWAAMLDHGKVGYLFPDYTAYEGLLEAVGLSVPRPIDDPRLDDPAQSAAALADAIDAQGLASVLISNPNNPTGRVRSDEELAAWISVARETGTTLALDEFYAHYVFDREEPVSGARYVEDVNEDPVLLFDGLTKNWRYPGFRLSWLVAPKQVIELLASCCAFMGGGTMRPLQRAVVPLLDPAVADQEAKVLRTYYARKQKLMAERLSRIGVRIGPLPRGTFYLWGDLSGLPEGWNTACGFLNRALDQQVIAIPGQAFDLNPEGSHAADIGEWDHHMRFSFGPEWSQLEAGFDRLEAALKG